MMPSGAGSVIEIVDHRHRASEAPLEPDNPNAPQLIAGLDMTQAC